MIAKSFDLVRYVGYFFQKLKVGGIYGSSTVDQQPKNVACQLMYGNMWRIPVPDIDRTDFMLLMGCGAHWRHHFQYSKTMPLAAAIQSVRSAIIRPPPGQAAPRSEEHTSELQSLMRHSYSVFCLQKKNKQH